MTEKDTRVKYGEIVQKAWDDETFKKKFIEDPEAALVDAGIPVEEGVTYKVIEAPKGVQYLVLPAESVKTPIQTLTRTLLEKAENSDAIIPQDVELRIVQNTDDIRYLILPPSPKTLSKAELGAVAGGDSAAISVAVCPGVTAVVVSYDPGPGPVVVYDPTPSATVAPGVVTATVVVLI